VALRDKPMRPKRTTWALVESVNSPVLGGMYADLLHQAGIPVRIEQWDPGGGALGGLTIGVRLLVPAELLGAAQEVLRGDEAGEGANHEG
jgi:hypothetical protein